MTERIVSTAANAGEHPSMMPQPPSSPVRIAFCITDLDIGGAERMFVELITRLDRRFWEPHVYCLSGAGALVEKLEAAAVPVICFGAKGLRHLDVIRRLASELKSFAPQLLQCFLFHANIVGRVAAWWAGVPHVICGIRVAERRSRFPLWLDRLTQGFVDHNVCVSQAVAKFAIEQGGLSPKKISVIPNAVDVKFFSTATAADRAEFVFSADAPLVLFVGRLDPQKAPLVLLEAFDRLLQRHPNWQLLFLGDGPLRSELEAEVARRGRTMQIRIAGWRPNVAEWLRAADVLALPSLWEGMPNIVLEAMAAGLPVVVSRVEGTEELVQEGVTGLLTEPGSASDLETNIEALLSDSEMACRISNAAQQNVATTFTFDGMVASYDKLFGDTFRS